MTDVPGALPINRDYAQQKAEDPAPNYPAPSNSGILLVGTGHGGNGLFRAGQAEEKRTPARRDFTAFSPDRSAPRGRDPPSHEATADRFRVAQYPILNGWKFAGIIIDVSNPAG